MTTRVTLDANWTEVATTPNLAERVTGTVFLHYAALAPGAGETAYHVLGEHTGSTLAYGGSANTYARAGGASAELIVTGNA